MSENNEEITIGEISEDEGEESGLEGFYSGYEEGGKRRTDDNSEFEGFGDDEEDTYEEDASDEFEGFTFEDGEDNYDE